MVPSEETLRRAGEILQEIGQLRTELETLFGRGGTGQAPAAKVAKATKKPRNMSPEARARIAAAAKARWIKYRADKKAAAKAA